MSVEIREGYIRVVKKAKESMNEERSPDPLSTMDVRGINCQVINQILSKN